MQLLIPVHLDINDLYRSEYEYEIEYECDYPNLVRRVYINMSNTNLVHRASFSTGQQQGGARALGT